MIRKLNTLFLATLFALHINAEETTYQYENIAENLSHPWSIAVIDENNILFTELTGSLRIIKDGALNPIPIAGVPDVLFAGQGGLSGLILDPEFLINQKLYLSFSSPDENQKTNTLEVISAKLISGNLTEVKTIFKASPSRDTAAHYGSRMAFLDDGTLLITSGDGFNYRERAQYLDNHFGKIIRINTDGSIPKDNPFINHKNAKPEIWSYGHRNLQGIVVVKGVVYENEHGPMGGDELNIIEPSKNYGWPAITYGKDYSGATISPFTEKEGMEQPIQYWVPSIAPSGMAFYHGSLFPEWKNSLFISALVPGDVRRLEILNSQVVDEEILFSDLGRVRDIATSPDGSLILATDGPKGKLIRVVRK
jgi:glucose/arabinose dehydrogenase